MKKLAGILIAAGLLALLGTAGSCDLERISIAQAIAQSALGVLLAAIGAGIIYYEEGKTE